MTLGSGSEPSLPGSYEITKGTRDATCERAVWLSCDVRRGEVFNNVLDCQNTSRLVCSLPGTGWFSPGVLHPLHHYGWHSVRWW